MGQDQEKRHGNGTVRAFPCETLSADMFVDVVFDAYSYVTCYVKHRLKSYFITYILS